jgi:hypothetical protein
MSLESSARLGGAIPARLDKPPQVKQLLRWDTIVPLMDGPYTLAITIGLGNWPLEARKDHTSSTPKICKDSVACQGDQRSPP